MDKKEFRELMDDEDKTLINFNPELNQSGIFEAAKVTGLKNLKENSLIIYQEGLSIQV